MRRAPASPPLVFISYRIADTKHVADRLAERLQHEFGSGAVFLDRMSIDGGETWPKAIRKGVGRARAVLVLVGPTWLTEQDQWGSRRLDLKNDWVRQEVALALTQRPGTLVLQVLVDGQAPMGSKLRTSPTS